METYYVVTTHLILTQEEVHSLRELLKGCKTDIIAYSTLKEKILEALETVPKA